MTATTSRLIDTHAHLDDDQFVGDLDGVIERASAAGVERIVNIGYRPARWQSTLALADRYPMISYALGLHPHHVDEWDPDVEATLTSLLHERRPVALGEIGLDYFRNLNPRDQQIDVFERQLGIAVEFQLPVIIHQRHAEQDLMHVLATVPADLVCVLHSFEGSSELAHFALDRGYLFGVGGLMTRASSTELRAVLQDVPLERILIETDAPYLAPSGVKNRRNEPANVVLIAEQLARLLDRSVEEIAAKTSANAARVFGIWIDRGERAAELCGMHE